MSISSSSHEISPAMRRKLNRLHKQMAAATAAGGVQPEPVTNKRTGEVHEFGPRRAFDGAWLDELLSYGGCTNADVEGFCYVLDLLLEHRVKINKSLVEGLSRRLPGWHPSHGRTARLSGRS